MKKCKLFILIIAALNMVACTGNDQIGRQIDPARLKKISYPPLTAREGLGLTLPVPPAEHPRLFFRKSDIPELKAKTTSSLLSASWTAISNSAKYSTTGSMSSFNQTVIDAIEARAFLYVINDDIKKGIEAVDYIFNLNNTYRYTKIGNYQWNLGRVILATALVYDWCYQLMGPSEKQQLIEVMETLAADLEVEWPRLVQSSVTSHGVEDQVARDILSCGVAVYDEKPEIYKRAAGRLFAEIIPVQNFGYTSGHHHQGSSYGPTRFICEMFTTFIFDRMGYTGLNRELQGKMPYYWMYSRRPDGQLFRDGDDWIDRNTSGYYWYFPDIAFTASHYKEPLFMGEAIRTGIAHAANNGALFRLLLINPNIAADNNLASLPLTKYFPSPFGGMVARTGWDAGINLSSGSVTAEMRIKERQYNGHQHLDAGSFQIYYKGPLAVESGIYEGTNGAYGSSHHTNYYQRTIAHNCMLVYNPSETFRHHAYGSVSNDGGQRWPKNAGQPLNLTALMDNEYKTGEVLAHDFGPNQMTPEYSYLKGDITAAYTNKVSNHKRAFVFLNFNNTQVPAALIVYDYLVSSNKDFKKTWLLHCAEEPVFNGNVCTVERKAKGYNGKLVNTVLLPLQENMNLAKVGGSGNEFSVAGKNYPQKFSNSNNSGDGAIWRIELSPKTSATTDVFLNVMQVTNSGNNNLLSVQKIETDRMTGVQIGDRIVLFSKTGNSESLPVNLTISGSGTFKVLITDLEKGNWGITGTQSPGTVRNENNQIYFQATAGNYVITKK